MFVLSMRFKILILFFLLLINGGSFAQITNPNSTYLTFGANRQNSQIQQKNNSNAVPELNKEYQMGIHGNDLIRQQQQSAMNQMGYHPPVVPTQNNPFPNQAKNQQLQKQSSISEVHKLLAEENYEKQSVEELEKLQRKNKVKHAYKAVYDEIMKMQNGQIPFSLKRAVFMVENVFSDYQLNYSEFNKMIEKRVTAIKQMMKDEKITADNHLGKNYIIQKLFKQNVQTNQGVIYPLKYDFEDYNAKNDWTKMFVYKLLKTGTGQCHSMPLLYLILAEETNTKAWLSLAPEHSFIQYTDNYGREWFNFETTSGKVVTTDWLMQSGYISSESIKNELYLDTLSKNGIISTLIADLTMGYIEKEWYDDFAFEMIKELEKVCCTNIQVHLMKADMVTVQTQNLMEKYHYPSVEQLMKYPELNAKYNEMLLQYDKLDNLGYMKMPEEIYQKWLASLDQEKQKTLKK